MPDDRSKASRHFVVMHLNAVVMLGLDWGRSLMYLLAQTLCATIVTAIMLTQWLLVGTKPPSYSVHGGSAPPGSVIGSAMASPTPLGGPAPVCDAWVHPCTRWGVRPGAGAYLLLLLLWLEFCFFVLGVGARETGREGFSVLIATLVRLASGSWPPLPRANFTHAGSGKLGLASHLAD
jgi:hypothetical protein